MTKKIEVRSLVIAVVLLSSGFANAGARLVRTTVGGLPVCTSNGEALVVKLPPPSTQSLLAVCDQTGPMKVPEPRPLSRAEAAKLYTETRGSASREDHEKDWAEKFGISAATLRKHDIDSEISAEQLIFAQSENVDDLKSLAALYAHTDASKIRVATLANDQDMRNFDSGRLRYFGTACEQRGGSFTIPTDQLMEESLTGVPVKISGKVVCRCGAETFSNPVDYSCNSSASGSARTFQEVRSGGAAGARTSASSATKR